MVDFRNNPGKEAKENERRALSDPLLIDVEEAARLLGISVRSVHRGVATGEIIPPVKVRGSTRWRLAELEAWVAAGCPRFAASNNTRRR